MRTINNDFGKLENGNINYSPIPLIVDGIPTWTNDRTLYLTNGYSEIVRTEQPTREGYYYTSSWEQTDEQTITEVWTEHEIVPSVPSVDVSKAYSNVESFNQNKMYRFGDIVSKDGTMYRYVYHKAYQGAWVESFWQIYSAI